MKKSIAMRFSTAAASYAEYAALQKAVAEKLLDYLPTSCQPQRILEIGCGTGLLTATLCRQFPAARIDAVDISAAMLQQAKCRISAARVHWIARDFLEMRTKQRYDLIASSSVLHWLSPLSAVAQKIGRLLRPHGVLLCALMTGGTLAELHRLRRRLFPHKPPPINLPSAVAVHCAFTGAELRMLRWKVEKIHVCAPSAMALLRQLHAQGVTSGPAAAAEHLLTRRELQRLAEEYERCFSAAAGVVATYRVVYFAAGRYNGR